MEQPREAFSAEKLQLFAAGLTGLDPAEVRKAKVLYIRNAVSEYKAMMSLFEGFGSGVGCLAIIPVFWPFIWKRRRLIAIQQKLAAELIQNAVDVWRDDLRGEKFDLGDRQIVCE